MVPKHKSCKLGGKANTTRHYLMDYHLVLHRIFHLIIFSNTLISWRFAFRRHWSLRGPCWNGDYLISGLSELESLPTGIFKLLHYWPDAGISQWEQTGTRWAINMDFLSILQPQDSSSCRVFQKNCWYTQIHFSRCIKQIVSEFCLSFFFCYWEIYHLP